jgi:hypothetical protein
MIEVNDTVICMDADHSFNRLVLGAEYKAVAGYDGTPVVVVNGAAHSIARFIPFIDLKHRDGRVGF